MAGTFLWPHRIEGQPLRQDPITCPAHAPSEGSLSQRPPGSVRGGSEHPELPPGNVPARGSNFSECEFHLPWWDVLCGGRGERRASLGCPQSDRPAAGREGPAGRVAGPSSPRPSVRPSVSTSLLRTRGLVTSACLPACPPHADCPRDLLAWKENTGCCGQANTAAVCPGIGAPVWRELADRTFCHLPALFQNSLALAGLAARGGGGLGAKNRAEESRALGPAG